MFTGIIEDLGVITAITTSGTNKTYWVKSGISSELKVDQSLSHNGVCLTVEEIREGEHRVTAVQETLEKSDMDGWQTGNLINLERCMQMNGRLDGHIVQGHVDSKGSILEKTDQNGSWLFTISFPEPFAHLVIEKGSVSLNGISLTSFNVTRNTLQVAIIPYTYNHTNLQAVNPGDMVNIEFDIIGKYISRWKSL